MRYFLKHLLLAASCILVVWQSALAQPRYAVIDLGTLGGTSSYAFAISNDGKVVGRAHTSSNIFHGFLWHNGAMIDLGTLGDPYSFHSLGEGINESGQIVGTSFSSGDSSRGFFWNAGTFTQLGTLGGRISHASGINSAGQVVGWSRLADFHDHAFVWENGVMTDLGSFGGDGSVATGINNAGQVTVWNIVYSDNSVHAFLWENGVTTPLGSLGGIHTAPSNGGINNVGHVVGQSTTSSGEGHAFLWRAGVMTDLGAGAATGINDSDQVVGFGPDARPVIWENNVAIPLDSLIDTSSGWVLQFATDINEKGEIVGYGTHNGQTRGFLLRSALAVSRPRPGERWIAGEQDTIRWTGGNPGLFLNIEFSVDSGITYTGVDFAIPADSGKYLWTVPDSLSTRATIRLSDVFTSDSLAVSDTFRVKGYRLTRIDANGHYERFSPPKHGWSFLNGTLWPSTWWSQFQYSTATDPYTNGPYPMFFHPVAASSFVDWHLWVEVFSESHNYWSTTLGVYKGPAQRKWKSHAKTHNGSCFGFAASSFLAFCFANQFFARHPGIPNLDSLFSLSLTNTIQKTINGYYAYQFGKQSLDNDVIGQPKDPRTTLQEIRNMFRNDVVDIRTITIYNGVGGNGGAHTMAPISVTVDGSGPSRYRVNLYDSNNPGLNTPYIMVDSLNNTWTDFTGLGATWTGNKKFYLEIPVSNYLTTPVIGRPPAGYSPKGTNNIEFYNNSKADVVYTASNGNRIGFVNGVVIDEIADGIAIFDKNGRPSDPVGYYIPDGNYSVELTRVKDSSGGAYVTVFKDDIVYGYKRVNNDSLLMDKLDCGDGFSVASTDSTVKNISLEIIARLDSSERMFNVRNTQLSQNDSVYVKEMSQSDLMLKNYGTGKTYDLALDTRSRINQRLFENFSIALQANSTHTIVPNWNNLAQPIPIYVDLGNNGTIDDTLVVSNTVDVDDRGSLGLPTEYDLAQNYPNPFNPATKIEYALPEQSHVTLGVYNMLGQHVATLADEVQPAGFKSTVFNASRLASGVYFYRMVARPARGQPFTSARKMLLVR